MFLEDEPWDVAHEWSCCRDVRGAALYAPLDEFELCPVDLLCVFFRRRRWDIDVGSELVYQMVHGVGLVDINVHLEWDGGKCLVDGFLDCLCFGLQLAQFLRSAQLPS